MSALHQIANTCQALNEALEARDWVTIGQLDLGCRALVDEALVADQEDATALKANLEALMAVYRQLIDVASDERQSLVAEMSNINQAKQATKVYHLFS
ncbi:flagellar protein FliT [Pseudomonas putida]|uniref:flagellar protein FliT n=1 Tax=Pseudomonas TaxID=286 RepID=UPI0011A5A56D|nr:MULTISPECIES: flagellar protein FliT [Pseudomonas]MBF8638517.1 flagellar protein FliT [Pseudomonas fulva]MBF8652833.1 flagellar protein FliT [Pseudomonas putida]MBF8657075.1 flagellar protein FliT [Pseudomonas putida]MBF8679706.1 flagellar protein FliT [Pseudomonas fulva]MBF8690507.1 flagellar protein FliT [Pseudomonas fulva]